MNRYHRQRNNYDDFSRGYDNYERFTRETLRKKEE